MTELDAFRPRIVNWARAFRNRRHIGSSPLYQVMRQLQMQAGTPSPAPVSEPGIRIDWKDASLLDQCALRLSPARLDVLRIAYLDRVSTEDFDTDKDFKRAEHKRARLVGLKSSRHWRAFLQDAEMALMDRVHTTENALTNIEK